MVKVLIADENTRQANSCYRYLSDNDQMLNISLAHNGVETLIKYNEMKTDILILNSRFKDINSAEIVNRLSSTIKERKKSNIIITINSKKEQLSFHNVAKVFSFLDKPLDLEELANTVGKIKSESKYTELTEDYLNKLLFSMKIIIGSYQTELLKEAIIEGYNYPYLLGNFENLMEIISYKHNGMDIQAIRSSIRSCLRNLNNSREQLASHPIVKMFDPSQNITPKSFLEVVVSYLHAKKNQEIIM